MMGSMNMTLLIKAINSQIVSSSLRAWKTYQTEISAGADGRPDFLERKTCNWITETFQVLNIDRNI